MVDYNTNAIKTYEKAGFVLEGRQRQADWSNRRWNDVLLYSISETEWEALRGISGSTQ